MSNKNWETENHLRHCHLVTWGYLQRPEKQPWKQRRVLDKWWMQASCLDSKPWVGTYCMLGDLMMVATGSEAELPSQPAAVCSSRTVCQELSCGRHSPTIPGAKIWFETKWKRAKQLVDIPMFLSYIAITLVIRDKGTWAHTVYLKQVRCCSRN